MKKPKSWANPGELSEAQYAEHQRYSEFLAKKAGQNVAYRDRRGKAERDAKEKATKLAKALEQAARKTNRIIPATREEWLMTAVELLKGPFAIRGYIIPEKVKVSIGFPSVGARGKRIGECWSDERSEAGNHEIFISPLLSEPMRILDILVHELGHACVGVKHAHRAPFKRFCTALNLEGKATATEAGPDCLAMLKPICEELGTLPHAALAFSVTPEKKQKARMLKCECPACGIVIRTAQKTLDTIIKNAMEMIRIPMMSCPDANCKGLWEIPLDGDKPEDE